MSEYLIPEKPGIALRAARTARALMGELDQGQCAALGEKLCPSVGYSKPYCLTVRTGEAGHKRQLKIRSEEDGVTCAHTFVCHKWPAVHDSREKDMCSWKW